MLHIGPLSVLSKSEIVAAFLLVSDTETYTQNISDQVKHTMMTASHESLAMPIKIPAMKFGAGSMAPDNHLTKIPASVQYGISCAYYA